MLHGSTIAMLHGSTKATANQLYHKLPRFYLHCLCIYMLATQTAEKIHHLPSNTFLQANGRIVISHNTHSDEHNSKKQTW